jgi:hypothetical protein
VFHCTTTDGNVVVVSFLRGGMCVRACVRDAGEGAISVRESKSV